MVATGLVVSLVASSSSFGIWLIGAPNGIGRIPGEQTLASGGTLLSFVCVADGPSGAYPGCIAFTQAIPAYVPATDVLVAGLVGARGGPIEEISPGNLSVFKSVYPGCALTTIYAPPFGTDVFLGCRVSTNQSDILVFDTRTGRIAESIPLPLGLECSGNMAFDIVHDFLYFSGYSNDTVIGLDISRSSFEAYLWAPGMRHGPPIAFDPSIGGIVYDDCPIRTLKAIDPTDGRILRSSGLSLWVDQLAIDTSRPRLYVVTASYATGPGNLTVFNSTTLTQIVRVALSLGFPGAGSPIIDRQHGDLYVNNSGGVVATKETTNRWAGSPTFGAGVSTITYDSKRDALIAGTGFDSLLRLNISHFDRTGAPYSATPSVGANLPWIIGVAGFTLGVGIAALGWWNRRTAVLVDRRSGAS